MTLTHVELRRVRLPLIAPFRSSASTQEVRDLLLVRACTTSAEGWAECAALPEPTYTEEYLDGAQDVIVHHLLPRLLAEPGVRAGEVAALLAGVKGHRMAKAALETAVLDAELRAAGVSLSTFLGARRDRVPAGVAVGITHSMDALLDSVGSFLDEGYQRVKLKISPGWDVEVVRAVRERFPMAALQVDANCSYTLADSDHLRRLDEFGLLLIEQPLGVDDLRGHAELGRRLETPICLDESITSATVAEHALAMGACSVVNVKAGRVGGYLEARRVHDVCVTAGVPAWCGGMLESGIGRAANLALAALPGCTLVGDLSASDRYFATDLTRPFALEDGHIAVPRGPGIGVDPVPVVLRRTTVAAETFRAVTPARTRRPGWK